MRGDIHSAVNEPTIEPNARNRNPRLARAARLARDLAMVLALIAGGMHVAQLWANPLERDTLLEAGRGVLLILLALGLMGSSRLSVVLVILFCGTALMNLYTLGSGLTPVAIVELVLVALATPALFAPRTFHSKNF